MYTAVVLGIPLVTHATATAASIGMLRFGRRLRFKLERPIATVEAKLGPWKSRVLQWSTREWFPRSTSTRRILELALLVGIACGVWLLLIAFLLYCR